MSETKWTPGPWEVVQRGHDQRKPVEVRGPKIPNILNVIIGPLVCKLSDVFGRSNAIANAHLIAAAPELLEELERMICMKLTLSPYALHPSGLFCEHCGFNSMEAVHFDNCPVFAAEKAAAKARGVNWQTPGALQRRAVALLNEEGEQS
jgi:hypothetical protein